MLLSRRSFLLGGLCLPLWAHPAAASAQAAPTSDASSLMVLTGWYEMILKLVRHTPTYSPPVAARAFAYFGIIAYELVAATRSDMSSLAGQLAGLKPYPFKQTNSTLNQPLLLHFALSAAAQSLFDHTGPTGQRAMAAFERQGEAALVKGVGQAQRGQCRAFGRSFTQHILRWSKEDGGSKVESLGFSGDYKRSDAAGHWRPTSTISLQQFPLMPNWRNNRPLVLGSASPCAIANPPPYSEEKGSAFYAQALEVYQTAKALTPEQKIIARFWSDDPMLSSTPPGHWVQIALSVMAEQGSSLPQYCDVLARLGIAVSDAFIACWREKYKFDLLRPVTYIKAHIDKTWEPLLITPPFPEYPSGHSEQSGAAQIVLEKTFGADFAFEDKSHVRDGYVGRQFAGFKAAAEEAGISRLYGGIHFRAAIENGLVQGRCIGAAVNGLRTLQ